MKRCNKCGKKYPATVDYFNRNRSKADGLQYSCKQCSSKIRFLYKRDDGPKASFKEIRCNYCRDLFKDVRELVRHKARSHGVGSILLEHIGL
jgi:DNA-directed RNA polymerase subunit RPC12/RpoP